MASQERDEPLQLIEFITEDGGGTIIQLKQDTIELICPKIGNRPISVINIAGPSRQGKSFLLGHMIRRLEGLERGQTDWMGWDDPTKPLEGFKFRNGRTPETNGIWVWSRPFIIKNNEDQEVAVLLVDTQGTNDEFTTTKDMLAIVGLSLLMSSEMIFNHFTNMQEDILTALDSYIQYGSLALDKLGGETPFQNMTFLIRDWNNPGEYPYGAEGGEMFLGEKLQLHPKHSAEAKHVRERIKSCFQTVDCFLMPYIGEEALDLEFKGSISELSLKFSKYMEAFITNLINPHSLKPKTLLGTPVTSSDLKSLLETYIKVFNSDEVPSAGNIWQATSQMCNSNLVEKSQKMYCNTMELAFHHSPYHSTDSLNTAHLQAMNEALKSFTDARKIGSQAMISEYEEKLISIIEKASTQFATENERRREKIIAGATKDASEKFAYLLENQFPFQGQLNTVFYDEAQMNAVAASEKSTLLKDFKAKLPNEDSRSISIHIQSLEATFQTMLSSHVNKNKVNYSNACKDMASRIQTLSSSYRSRFQQYLTNNKYEDNEANLQNIHKAFISTIVQEYQQRKMPGNIAFQQGYLTELHAKIEQHFNQMKTAHMLHLQQIRAAALKSVTEFDAKYKSLLNDGIYSFKSLAVLQQRHNSTKTTVTSQLKSALGGMGITTSIIGQYEMELNRRIEVSFADAKKLFDSIQAQAAAQALAARRAQEAADAERARQVAEANARAAEKRARKEAAARAAEAEAQRKAIEANQARINALTASLNRRRFPDCLTT